MDINPAGIDQVGSLTAVGSLVYFSATDGAAGRELWRSDGTTAGTCLRPGHLARVAVLPRFRPRCGLWSGPVLRGPTTATGNEIWALLRRGHAPSAARAPSPDRRRDVEAAAASASSTSILPGPLRRHRCGHVALRVRVRTRARPSRSLRRDGAHSDVRGWSGDCSGTATCTVDLTLDRARRRRLRLVRIRPPLVNAGRDQVVELGSSRHSSPAPRSIPTGTPSSYEWHDVIGTPLSSGSQLMVTLVSAAMRSRLASTMAGGVGSDTATVVTVRDSDRARGAGDRARRRPALHGTAGGRRSGRRRISVVWPGST